MSKIIYENNTIKKIFFNWQYERFLNEIHWLKKFKNCDFTPKILKINFEKKIIELTNVGVRINSTNLPKNWLNQLGTILKTLKQNNCFHGDINSENILVKNKKLKLIDFAQSGQIFDKNIIYIKKRMFFDEYSKNRIDLNLNKIDYRSNDLRTLIVWDKSNEELVDKEIKKNKNFKIIDKILLSKNCYEDVFKDRIFWLDKFYNREIDRNSPKLTKDIICYIILSKKSFFEQKKMLFTNEVRYVDNNIFEFKKKIRNKRKNIIHISDNFEEAKRNAFYISRNKNNYPYKYFTKSQFKHQSLSNLVDGLNKNKKLKYIFIRNRLDKSGDIDVLCNNYFLFKKEIDGQSFKHKNLRLISNSGDPVEDYGFKVANFAKIKNEEICFDVRYLGDNYLCEHWQKELLNRRTKYQNHYTLSFNDKLYTLIYHIVYHKGYIDKKYHPILKKNLKKIILTLNI